MKLVYPEKLGIWETILNNSYDATWIFLNWEGVLAEHQKEELLYFKLKDFDIPYSYSPVIATNGNKIDDSFKEYQAFLKATKRGYLFCKENPAQACDILYKHLPEHDKKINLSKALSESVSAFGENNNWGVLEEDNVKSFLNWLKNTKLETTNFKLEELATNNLLKENAC